ncbi:MAG: pimeloyl-ACP methyl ester esterase BioH [Gammaproteobacteria bacterium]|nr:pimeloyl-ACP methyl ester esterase BioH [Gammaproteobacteria bacterium]
MQVSFQQWGNRESQQQILLIHGWGMNSGVWSDIARRLEQHYPDFLIRSVDLPGYGQSAAYNIEALGGVYTARTLAQSLLPLFEGKQTIVIAWSLGGLVALELSADQRINLAQLILVSSTPRFVQDGEWQNAVEAPLFEEFCQSLAEDHQATLKRFLAIQALGSRTAREDIKTLQAQLFKRGEPDLWALEYGLQMLLKEDKRQQLQKITDIPISLISGKLDTLVKYQGQQQLAEQDNISLFTLSTAGHAPFISHPEQFTMILQDII